MKKYFYTLFVAYCVLNVAAQTPFWTESFGTGCNKGQLAAGFAPSSNGTWTITNLYTPPPFPFPSVNDWFISATESGMGVGVCGNSCLASGGNNRTLHIGQNNPSSSQVDNGAYYTSSAFATNKRVESPLINCSGESNICLSFNYIMGGVSGTDFAEVLYSPNGGLSWIPIGIPPKTTTCSINKSVWSTYSVSLPGSIDNNSNVKIGFRWQSSTSSSSVISVAIDDITLTSIPLTSFLPNFGMVFPLCENSTSTLTAVTGTYAASGYTWSVNPSGPIISSPNASSTPISFLSPGTFSITLTATSGTQTASNTQTAVINASAAVAASINPMISMVCQGKSGTITAYGNATTYTWYPMTTTINPIVVSPSVSTTYTTIGTNSLGCTGTRSITLFIAPNPTITASGPTLACSGNTVCLTASMSPGGPGVYQWAGPCGFTSTQQSPCFPINTGCGCTYTITVQNTSGCYGKDTICINVSSCTGLKEIYLQSDMFNLFPNPARDKIYIRANQTTENVKIEIHDITGRGLFQTNPRNLDAAENLIVNVEDLDPGIYFVKIISKDTVFQQVKILKE